MASYNACEYGPPPQLLLVATTFTPLLFMALVYPRHSIASDSAPAPVASMNLQAMIFTFQFNPVIPVPLLPAAPIVPAQCVPWPWSSIGLPVPATELMPNTSST